MIKRLFENIIYAAIISILIIVLGVLISYVVLGDKNKVDLTLFILGAIPIILFLPSIFSKSQSGALHTPKVIFRKVDTLEKRDKFNQSNADEKSKYSSPIILVLAGLLTWLAGVII